MQFHTEINIKPLEKTIVYADGLLFLGSCFADEVGGTCRGLGFDALVNPFGVLYNPASIAQSVERLQSGKPFSHDDVIAVGEGQYCTFSHNTAFWRSSKAELLEQVNQSLAEAHEHFMKSKWLIISLGTSWVFRNKENGLVVSNCHKRPANQFEKELLSVEKSVQYLSDIVAQHPEKQFIFTVSPLRHLKDGLHGNQLSKAALLLAVDEVCNRFENAHYFPAYEIVMDELRDYRFYAADMLHPSEQAVAYVWERLVAWCFSNEAKVFMDEWRPIRQALTHRPFNPESEEYQRFMLQTQERLKAFQKKWQLTTTRTT